MWTLQLPTLNPAMVFVPMRKHDNICSQREKMR